MDDEHREASSNKCHASSNKCLTSSNKKLLETSALLLATIRYFLVQDWKHLVWVAGDLPGLFGRIPRAGAHGNMTLLPS